MPNLSISSALQSREEISAEEAQKLLDQAIKQVEQGEDPFYIVDHQLQLEPDYVFELLPYAELNLTTIF